MISSNCPLILTDCYFYDFKSAFPRILKSIGYNLDVDYSNKTERNIQIGKEQIDNSELQEYLTTTINNLVSLYKNENNITDDDIIVQQKDGFISKKKLYNLKLAMELDFRGDVDFIIITPDRKSFMQSVNGKIEVKGVQNKYKGIQKVYDRFIDLNFFDKKILFEQMHKIKRFILDSNDVNIFKIKTSDDLEIVRCKDGEYEYTDDLPTNEIAKYKYFKHYIKPFLDQIFLTFNN